MFRLYQSFFALVALGSLCMQVDAKKCLENEKEVFVVAMNRFIMFDENLKHPDSTYRISECNFEGENSIFTLTGNFVLNEKHICSLSFKYVQIAGTPANKVGFLNKDSIHKEDCKQIEGLETDSLDGLPEELPMYSSRQKKQHEVHSEPDSHDHGNKLPEKFTLVSSEHIDATVEPSEELKERYRQVLKELEEKNRSKANIRGDIDELNPTFRADYADVMDELKEKHGHRANPPLQEKSLISEETRQNYAAVLQELKQKAKKETEAKEEEITYPTPSADMKLRFDAVLAELNQKHGQHEPEEINYPKPSADTKLKFDAVLTELSQKHGQHEPEKQLPVTEEKHQQKVEHDLLAPTQTLEAAKEDADKLKFFQMLTFSGDYALTPDQQTHLASALKTLTAKHKIGDDAVEKAALNHAASRAGAFGDCDSSMVDSYIKDALSVLKLTEGQSINKNLVSCKSQVVAGLNVNLSIGASEQADCHFHLFYPLLNKPVQVQVVRKNCIQGDDHLLF